MFDAHKKNRTAITINLVAVPRRDLLYEIESCKKSISNKSLFLRAILNSGVACYPQFRSSPYPQLKGTHSYLILSYIIRTHVDCYPALGAGD